MDDRPRGDWLALWSAGGAGAERPEAAGCLRDDERAQLCTLGIFSFAIAGIDGSVYQILSHEISGSALLVLFGFLYERFGTYDIASYGGLAAKMPRYTTLFVITTLSLIGLPILNGFVGEFLILSSSFGVHARWATAATIGVILSAAYMLWMVQRVFYGPTSSLVAGKGAPDMLLREDLALWPAAVLMFIMGVASPFWIRAIDPTVTSLVGTIQAHPCRLRRCRRSRRNQGRPARSWRRSDEPDREFLPNPARGDPHRDRRGGHDD